MVKKALQSLYLMFMAVILVAYNTSVAHAVLIVPDPEIPGATLNNFYTNNGIVFYEGGFEHCKGDTPGGGGGNDNKDKWVSGLSPPYSLETFVVEVLKDAAKKMGVSESATVTKEHVIALVAFAWGEGGNMTNGDIYNPWNTGYDADDLHPVGGHDESGVQSYASFDDGVEATARVMTGGYQTHGYQSRLGEVLKNPNSTAADFMKTLTYYQNFQGNKPWATASMPPNQEKYLEQRGTLIENTLKNYVDYASTQIGPPGNNYEKGLHVPASDLKFVPSGVTGPGAAKTDPCQKTGIGAYKNPLRDVKNLQPMRIDQGVDYGGTGPVYAIGNGKVTLVYAENSGSGWPGHGVSGGGAFIAYQLSDGPAAGKYVYFTEDCPPKVKVGDPVTADTVICNMYKGGTNTEIGWGVPPSQGSSALATYYYQGLSTSLGYNMSDLLKKLGAPAGAFDKVKDTTPLPAGWPVW